MSAPITADATARTGLAIDTAAYHACNRAWRAPEPCRIDWDRITPLPDTAPQFWRDAPAEWLFRGHAAYIAHVCEARR